MKKHPLSPLLQNPKIILSTIWVFVLMNMIYADILDTLKPGYLETLEEISQTLSGEAVLFFAILMEVPIIMILLSRILNRKANRLANFIAAPLSILWVVVPSILSMGGSTPLSYVFFATVEVIAMMFIIWYAFHWPQQGAPKLTQAS
jgi:hypothetical protein